MGNNIDALTTVFTEFYYWVEQKFEINDAVEKAIAAAE